MRCTPCASLTPAQLPPGGPTVEFQHFTALEKSAARGCELCSVLLWNARYDAGYHPEVYLGRVLDVFRSREPHELLKLSRAADDTRLVLVDGRFAEMEVARSLLRKGSSGDVQSECKALEIQARRGD